MEKRLLFGMAGVVLAVLCALAAQAMTDASGCRGEACLAVLEGAANGGGH